MALLACEAKEAVTQVFVGLKDASELRRDRRNILMVHAACRHALVLGVDQDRNASRLERFSDTIRDLRSHGFLRL